MCFFIKILAIAKSINLLTKNDEIISSKFEVSNVVVITVETLKNVINIL